MRDIVTELQSIFRNLCFFESCHVASAEQGCPQIKMNYGNGGLYVSREQRIIKGLGESTC